MELNQICDKIISDAQNEAQSILNDAKEKARVLIKTKEEKYRSYGDEIRLKSKTTAKDVYDRIISNAKLTGSKKILTHKRQLIDECFSEVLIKLNQLSKEEFRNLIKLKSKGIEEKATFMFSKQNREHVNVVFLKTINPRFSISEDIVPSGFKIVLEQTQINYNFEEIVEGLKEEFVAEVANILFSE